jgi:hypothetical protein
MKTQYMFIAILLALIAPGFTIKTYAATQPPSTAEFQPSDERSVQDTLAKAHDVLWDTLYKTKIEVDEKNGNYSAIFPNEVQKLNGQTIKISGFMLPLENSEKFTHFLLSKRTPTCFFCPPGEPNEIIEVYATKPTEWAEDLVTYEGKFELTRNKQTGIFFRMLNAVKK